MENNLNLKGRILKKFNSNITLPRESTDYIDVLIVTSLAFKRSRGENKIYNQIFSVRFFDSLAREVNGGFSVGDKVSIAGQLGHKVMVKKDDHTSFPALQVYGYSIEISNDADLAQYNTTNTTIDDKDQSDDPEEEPPL